MNSKVVGRLGLALAVASTLAASAGSGQDKDPRAQPRKPPARPGNHLTKSPKLVGGILLPGNPLVFDISWVDQARARYYLAESVINLKDPKAPVVEARYPTPDCGSGLALGPSQHLLVGCGRGRPLLMLNGLNGTVITAVAETHGADEVWYNSGDN